MHHPHTADSSNILALAVIMPHRQLFRRTIVMLLLMAALCGVLSGCRGGLFTVAMSRLNVRIRKGLFDNLVDLEISFFDMTQTGEAVLRTGELKRAGALLVCLLIKRLKVFL